MSSFKIGNVLIKHNIVMAPMAGISNTTYRRICKKFGDILVVSEMVSDKALIYGNEKTLELLKMNEDERPISEQIFGGCPESLSKGAQIIVSVMHPDILDINMGCPVPKIALRSEAGSSLLKNPELVRKIVTEVVKKVNIPVTVKIRSGWDESSINAVEIAKICEESGASAITIHARTKAQGYTGFANWKIIKDVVDAVSIPVIGNGDVLSCYDAARMLKETGCAAVMIGRGLLGNPWLIKECIDYIESGIEPRIIAPIEKIEMMKYHLNELVKDKPEKLAILEIRSHFLYYLKGLPNNKEIKVNLCKSNSKEEIINLLDEYVENNKEYFK
ncbi:MAG: tRNA dihydrouridine synthase DusB [Bacilli bacterium]